LSHWKIQEQVVAADVIVIPLSCSEPSSPLLQHHRVLHQFYVTYQYKKEYAQLLLFYQHQCEQQLFLVYFKSLAISYELKSKVRECFVSFCHLVSIHSFLNSSFFFSRS
jgi:hypothetical protein